MSQTLYEILFFFAIIAVIVVHEAGHFFAAKACKMKVEEFFVGFGPRLWSTRRGETEYGVKAIPLGGYVRIAGMNPLQPPSEEDRGRTYADKPTWQRLLVVGCGPLTHFVLAILILGSVLVFFGTPKYGAHPVIDSVSPTLVNGAPSPAAAAGLKGGDAIVSVNGKPVDTADDLVPVLRANAGNPVHIVYVRDGTRHDTTVTPELASLDGKQVALIGIQIPRRLGYDRANPFTAIVRGTRLTYDISAAVVARMGQVFGPSGIHRIIDLLGGAPRKTTDVGTVVGTARLAGQAAASQDWADLLVLFATVNIFVGILNLLPVPPFDGGHVAVALWEKVTRRRVDPRRLIPVAAVVMGFLVLFSVSVLYLDLVNPIPNPFR
jgi:membrane-associated protease RseP (regulator of RpoE activity)